ncbi:hypothetical protein EXW72_04460 [Pseudomonas sp. BCA14]|uniref:hypothetical protein n=1 Tax=unclassified Pseudomonas TaxID=196821 RepID=UPI00106DD64C|nr:MULTISPECIES: hypothetical protein [unclassified Pseudomonas]TFF14442.1 hypothetical protein EXW70_08025 [Pseudomonas sp. JMN1]TFF14874.1 hypothetical protein EXW71_01015 [Pseudomonas sp. BCA17]TFF31280.1 hypothetical protein EXW72_04460 [Pseudomonas sp. BCA14]TFF32234.1 hypothetical protein EXW73_00265 [Pseudomonas sp. BCA13]
MSTLMSFFLDTLQPCLNDPANAKLWLPRQLAQMNGSDGHLVLPLHADQQDLGYLTGDNGSYIAEQFAENWSIVNQQDCVPDPNKQYPHLSLSAIQVDGLQNIFVNPSASTLTGQGYSISLPLLFNYYNASSGQKDLPQLTMSGNYHIDQSLLIGDAPNTSTTDIIGTGAFSVVFSESMLNAQASLTIEGSAAMRSLAIAVSELQVTGVQGGPVKLNFTQLTLDGDFTGKDQLIETIKDALNDPEGQAAMVGTLSNMLNSPSNLQSVNNMLGTQTESLMSSVFGPLPAQGMPGDDSGQDAASPVDLFLFDRMRVALNEADSNWYLPWQLASSSDPVLEPYSNPQVNVPDQTLGGLKYTNIQLTNLTLTGGSNAQAPLAAVTLSTPRIAATLNFGGLAQGPVRQLDRPGPPVRQPVPPAPPLKVNAGFSLIQQGIKPVPLVGTLTATLVNLQSALTITPSGADVNDLTLTISDISARLDSAQIGVSVTLTPHDAALEQIIGRLFQKPEVQSQIANALNNALSAQAPQLSEEFSQIARKAILNQLNS